MNIAREQYEADIKAAKAEGWDEAIAYSSITEAEADEHRAENPYKEEPAIDSESGE